MTNVLPTREKIIDTASRLFFRNGFSVGVDRIIAESNVAKMSLYRYFPSKTDLVIETIRSAHSLMMERLTGLMTDVESDKGKLENAFRLVCTLPIDPVVRSRLTTAALVDFPPGGPVAEVAAQSKVDVLLFLERACKTARIASAERKARALMVLADGFVVMAAFSDPDELWSTVLGAARAILA